MRAAAAFTLLELVVVIALISVVLAFSLPRITSVFTLDPGARVSHWTLTTVRELKARSVAEGTSYRLDIDIDGGRFRVSKATDPEVFHEQDDAVDYRLDNGMQLVDVEFAGSPPVSGGQAAVRFHPRGFSDDVLVHFLDPEGQPLTFHVPPLLPTARRYDRIVRYDSF